MFWDEQVAAHFLFLLLSSTAEESSVGLFAPPLKLLREKEVIHPEACLTGQNHLKAVFYTKLTVLLHCEKQLGINRYLMAKDKCGCVQGQKETRAFTAEDKD